VVVDTRFVSLSTRLLSEETWQDFAGLVDENHGVWGGCWCMGFHPEGLVGSRSPEDNRERKLAHVRSGTVRQLLVYEDDDRCVGWSQFGPPAQVATITNAKAYAAALGRLPDWRVGASSPERATAVAASRGRRWVLHCGRSVRAVAV
jgi:hypothetical protein